MRTIGQRVYIVHPIEGRMEGEIVDTTRDSMMIQWGRFGTISEEPKDNENIKLCQKQGKKQPENAENATRTATPETPAPPAKAKTLEAYQKLEAYLIGYYTQMIEKQKRTLEKYPSDIVTQTKLNLYKEILFKLTYEKP